MAPAGRWIRAGTSHRSRRQDSFLLTRKMRLDSGNQTPAAQRRAIVLVNPNARRGKEPIEPIVEQMRVGGLSVTTESFFNLPEITRDIAKLRSQADCLVVCGGDGTFSSASMAIMASGLPLGILPAGTANDLARTLNIPRDLRRAAAIIVKGVTKRIDIGSVNGHGFFNVASVGLSTELADGLRPETKRRWGRLSYAIAAAKVLLKSSQFRADITVTDEPISVKTYQIAVGNGRHYGGGNVISADAAIDDGYLDFYSLELSNVWKLVLMLRSFRAGRHGAWKEVRMARCTQCRISTRRPLPINADGELVTTTPATFLVHPSAISVYVSG